MLQRKAPSKAQLETDMHSLTLCNAMLLGKLYLILIILPYEFEPSNLYKNKNKPGYPSRLYGWGSVPVVQDLLKGVFHLQGQK